MTSSEGNDPRAEAPQLRTSTVDGVRFCQFPVFSDTRGNLSVGEFGSAFPFEPKRYFFVTDVPPGERRGEHAHRACQELILCLQGSVVVVADDGSRREEITLDDQSVGLYLPPHVWREQYKYSPGCVTLVFASLHYDTADYIRDYDMFLAERRSQP